MPKAWQDNITTSWFRAAFLNIFYNHINPLGLKIQPLIRINILNVLKSLRNCQNIQPFSQSI
jgi:hypothetical protein